MTALRYRPAVSGGWLIVADGGRALIVGPSGWKVADDAAEVIGGDGGFEATVDVIARDGFASIPDFVLLEWAGDRVRSLLRGPVTLAVTDAAGEHTQDGSGISTWTERSFTGATAVRATVDGAADAPDIEALALRSGTGYVASCALDFSRDAPPRPATDAAPSSVAPAAFPPAASPPASEPEGPTAEAFDEVSDETVSSVPEETSVPVGDTIVTTATPAVGNESASDATIVRSAAGADTIAPPPPAASDDRPGDHDGNTVLSSDIARLRARRGSKAPGARATVAVTVPGLFLALADGSRERLDQPVLIGRSPSVSQVSGDRMPRLVTVGGGDQDISRNHAQFAVEGGTVVVTDLHSRNGTVVVLPGKSPQKLRAGEPTSVIVGTVVDLGGGITLTVGEE